MTETHYRRFYCPHLRPGLVELDSAEAHHAAQVLRLTPGQQVELFDGKGNVAAGPLEQVTKRRVSVQVEQVVSVDPQRPEITLAFAVPKGKRLDWLLEKATELGAARLQPIEFARSVAAPADPGSGKWDRWMGHCIAAAKQSGLNHLPRIEPGINLDGFLASAESFDLSLLGDASAPPGSLPAQLQTAQPACLAVLVGPEGGLAEQEQEAAKLAGFRPVCIGRTILRVETAAVALLAAVRAWAGA
ncbi:MAG: RsmE family RNA methyltransferase [Phycisphaerae bacterium]